MSQDKLLDIFKAHLREIDTDTDGVQDLIYNTVGDYMAHLMSIGNIPEHMLDTLENDLRDEVMDIYRKITYGFLTLKDYKAAQQLKVKKSRAV